MFGILLLGLMVWGMIVWMRKGKNGVSQTQIEIEDAERKRRFRQDRKLAYKMGMKIVSALAKR